MFSATQLMNLLFSWEGGGQTVYIIVQVKKVLIYPWTG